MAGGVGTPAEAPDLTNPCERAKYLRAAYLRALSGEKEELVRYRSNEVEREIRFSKIDLSELREEMRLAEDECQKSQGETRTRRRYAIGAGSRRW